MNLLKELAIRKAWDLSRTDYPLDRVNKKNPYNQDYVDGIVHNHPNAQNAYDFWSGSALDMPKVFTAVLITSLKDDKFVSGFMNREFTHPEQIRTVNGYLELIVLFYAVRFGREKTLEFFGTEAFALHLRTAYGILAGLRLYDEIYVESLLRRFVE